MYVSGSAGRTRIRLREGDGVAGSKGPGLLSRPLVEGRRLETQRAEVHVPLTAVMDLVVDHVEDQVVQDAGVLAERRECLPESLRRNLRPQGVEFLGAGVPKAQHLLLRAGLAAGR